MQCSWTVLVFSTMLKKTSKHDETISQLLASIRLKQHTGLSTEFKSPRRQKFITNFLLN